VCVARATFSRRPHRRSVRAITLSTSPISKLRAGKGLADLKIEKAVVVGERRTVEADLGRVRYLATLIGADNETVLRWFILVVALLLDSAAVLLLLAATRTRS
jgi:hypothetical protein